MQNKTLIHLDTVDGTPTYDNAFATRNKKLGSYFANSSMHYYNTTIPIAVPVQNVKSLELNMVEFPMTTPNIRNANGSDSFSFTFNYSSYTNQKMTVYLNTKNHTSIESLLFEINSSIVASIAGSSGYSGFFVTFSVNPDDLTKIMVKSNCSTSSGQLSNLSFTSGILTNTILGINPYGDFSITSSNITYFYCTNNWNLQPDNYFNMSITNIQTAPANANGRPSSFKIPVNGTYGQVIYYDRGNQVLQVDRQNSRLDKVCLVITDRWGFPVFASGSQISFSLLIGY